MCSYTVPGLGGVDTKDNVLTWPTQSFTTMLQGSRKGYKSSPFFKAAVLTERSGAQNTLDCIIEDMSLKNASLPIGFKWGYKNPDHTFLMPVMDIAFHNKHKMVMVARDPRDLCTAHNQGHYHRFGETFLGEPVDNSVRQCMRFFALAWAPVLQDYGSNENLMIVRIEDLVMPNPEASNTSQQILKRIMEHAADISPSTEQLQEELKEAHAHADSYMGHHYGTNLAQIAILEKKAASYTGEVHDMMKALGYHAEHYGLIDPSHPRVLSPSAFF